MAPSVPLNHAVRCVRDTRDVRCGAPTGAPTSVKRVRWETRLCPEPPGTAQPCAVASDCGDETGMAARPVRDVQARIRPRKNGLPSLDTELAG